MQAAADLAKQKNLSLLSGLQSRFHNGYRECVQRIHDGAIGKVVAMQVMFLRGPYQIVNRNPAYTETQYQFSNWYHFCWLSGDDVTQSLVHNMDRAAWILKEEMPTWCFGLGGRSASFGDAYGDMYDHHTVVYEYASGTRVYALCRTQNNCYGNSGDIIMGTKGQCDLGNCRITGENELAFQGSRQQPLSRRAAGPDRIGPQRQADQQRLLHGRQHDVDRAGPIGLLHGPAAEVGRRGQVRLPVRPRPGRRQFRHAAALEAGRHRQLPAAQAGLYERSLESPPRSRRSNRAAYPMPLGRTKQMWQTVHRTAQLRPMPMHATLLAIALAAGVVAAPARKQPPPAKTRVLIVTGVDPWHDWKKTAPVVQAAWSRTRGSRPASSRTPSSSPRRCWPTTTSSCWSSTIPSRCGIRPRPRRTWPQLVEQGKGLVVLHFSCGAFSTLARVFGPGRPDLGPQDDSRSPRPVHREDHRPGAPHHPRHGRFPGRRRALRLPDGRQGRWTSWPRPVPR